MTEFMFPDRTTIYSPGHSGHEPFSVVGATKEDAELWWRLAVKTRGRPPYRIIVRPREAQTN